MKLAHPSRIIIIIKYNNNNNKNHNNIELRIKRRICRIPQSGQSLIKSDNLDYLIDLLKIPLQQRTLNQMVNIEEKVLRDLGEGN